MSKRLSILRPAIAGCGSLMPGRRTALGATLIAACLASLLSIGGASAPAAQLSALAVGPAIPVAGGPALKSGAGSQPRPTRNPTPRIGTFDVRKPNGGTFVMAKNGERQRKMQFALGLPAQCTYGNGEVSSQYKGAGFVQKHFIPIKKGSFKLNRTSRTPAAGGLLTLTTRIKISATFKTVTKLVGEATVVATYAPNPEAPPTSSPIFPGGTMTCKATNVAFTAAYR